MIFRGGVTLIAFVYLFFHYWQPGDSLAEMGESLVLAILLSVMVFMLSLLVTTFVSGALPKVEEKINEWEALNFRSVDPKYRQNGYFEFYTMDGSKRTQRYIPHYKASKYTHFGDSIVVEVFEIRAKKGWLTRIFGEGFIDYRFNIWFPESYFQAHYS